MRALIALALLLSASFGFAAPGATPAGEGPKTELEKTLYTLGYELTRNISGFDLTPEDMKFVLQGINDSMRKKQSVTDVDLYGPKIRGLEESRRLAKTASEKKRAREYLEKAAQAKGAFRGPSGFVYTELRAGGGPAPASTDTVKAHTRGTLVDGLVFDDSAARGTAASFTLNRVIPCWTAGISRMRVGGKSRLVCPSDLAFGDDGEATARIPGGAAVVFEIELLEIVSQKPLAPEDPLAEDRVPQMAPLSFAHPEALQYQSGSGEGEMVMHQHHHGNGPVEDLDTDPPLGPEAYPYYAEGRIHPPKSYEAEKRFSKPDLQRMEQALTAAHRYADINRAFQDGFTLEEKFGLGMGIHVYHLPRVMSDAVEAGNPEFLTYVLNRKTGRFQLMQVGYVHRGHKDHRPYKLFDAAEAVGHFHDDNLCIRRRGLVLDNLPSEGRCDRKGDLRVGPVWMMHLAVNLYNKNGMFSDYFPYVNRLSRRDESYTFYGRKVAEPLP